MAEMRPADEPTAGGAGMAHEAALYRLLRSGLRDDWTVVHDVAVDDGPFARQIDFLLLHRSLGLIVLEAKASDWRRQGDRVECKNRGHNVWLVTDDPLEQARTALIALWGKLDRDPRFARLRADGLFLPMQHAVAMLDMHGEAAQALARDLRAPDRFLFADEPDPEAWARGLLLANGDHVAVEPRFASWARIVLDRFTPRPRSGLEQRPAAQQKPPPTEAVEIAPAPVPRARPEPQPVPAIATASEFAAIAKTFAPSAKAAAPVQRRSFRIGAGPLAVAIALVAMSAGWALWTPREATLENKTVLAPPMLQPPAPVPRSVGPVLAAPPPFNVPVIVGVPSPNQQQAGLENKGPPPVSPPTQLAPPPQQLPKPVAMQPPLPMPAPAPVVRSPNLSGAVLASARAPYADAVRMPAAPMLPALPTPVLAVPTPPQREAQREAAAEPSPRSMAEMPDRSGDLGDVDTAPLEGRAAVQRALESVRDRAPGQLTQWSDGVANGYVTVVAPSPDRPNCVRYRITRNDVSPMEIRFVRRCGGTLSD